MQKKILFRITSLALSALCFSGVLFGVSFSSSSAEIDNSISIYQNSYQTLRGSDLLYQITRDKNISDLEKQYVNDEGYCLKYEANPNKNKFDYISYNGGCYIYAYEYSFRDANRKTWTWKPSYVNYGFDFYSFVPGDNYCVYFPNHDDLDEPVSIFYELEIELPKDKVNSLINCTADLGEQYSNERKNILKANEETKAKYEQDLATYNQYVEDLASYNQSLEEYNAYRKAKAEYDVAKEAYDDYLDAYKQYELELQAYEQNQKDLKKYDDDSKRYQQYLADLDYYNSHYEENKAAYDDFMQNYGLYMYRLEAMDIAFRYMTPLNRCVYDAIMGSTVTSVCERKSDLTQLGVPSEAIDMAYNSTMQLRILFDEYLDCMTMKSKYAYYYYHYSMIKDNVEDLLRALDKLYRTGSVKNTLEAQDKKEKYLILVAQLAYLANAIDNKDVANYEKYKRISSGSAVIDENWKIDGKTYKQLLPGEVFLDTTQNAYPTNANFPDEVVELLEKPTPVPNPGTRPAVMTKPTAPTPVANPGSAPTPVANPGSAPEEVLCPNEPSYQVFDASKVAFADAYDANIIYHRENYDKDIAFKVYDQGTGSPRDNQKYLVNFRNLDGDIVYSTICDGVATYKGKYPEKPEDIYYNDYLFVAWVDANGNEVDLSNITSSIDLYPTYIGQNSKKYNITWIIGDEIINEVYRADELPIPPENPSLPDTEDHFYVFIGWDKDIEIVVEDATYTAIFEEHNIYKVTFDVNGELTTYSYYENSLIDEFDIPIITNKPDTEDHYYKIIGWDKEIVPVTQTTTYTALYEEFNFYTVTWVVDGIVTDEEVYKEEELPTYKLETPSKEETLEHYYIYAGWDRDLQEPLDGDITITALFDIKNIFKICWVLDGGLIIEEHYKDFETINVPAPSKPHDYNYTYTFSGWDKELEMIPTQDMTYTAQFESHPILIKDNKELTIKIIDGVITLDVSAYGDNEIDLSPLLSLMEIDYEIMPIDIIGVDFKISFTRAQTTLLVQNDIAIFDFVHESLINKEHKFILDILDSNRNPININNLNISLIVNGDYDITHSSIYTNDGEVRGTFTKEKLEIKIVPNTEYFVYPTYFISVNQNERAEISTNVSSAKCGDAITLTVTPVYGYCVNEIFVFNSRGDNIEIVDGKFIMPLSDVSISVSMNKVLYTIEFYSEDKLITSMQVYYGDTIKAPSDPKKAPDEEYKYVFVGWDHEVSTATKDDVFHATYQAYPIKPPVIEEKVSIVAIVKYSALGVGVIGVGCVVLVGVKKHWWTKLGKKIASIFKK